MTRSEFVIAWKRQTVSLTHCFYCGKEFLTGPGSNNPHNPFRKTVEHLIPKHEFRGQVSKSNNLVWACGGCNNAKNGTSIRLFRQWMDKPFFSETVLRTEFPCSDTSPMGTGHADIHLKAMVEKSYKLWLRLVEDRFRNKDLKQRLHKISQTAQNEYRNRSSLY